MMNKPLLVRDISHLQSQGPANAGFWQFWKQEDINIINILLLILLAMISASVESSDTESIGWGGTTIESAVDGCAAYYAKGVMEDAAIYWGYIDSRDEYKSWLKENELVGAVALYHAGDKGRKVHILWPDGTLDGPYLAIESVAKHHYNLGMNKNMVIDVDYHTAQRYDMKGPVRVVVLYDIDYVFDPLSGAQKSIMVPGYETEKYEGCINKN